MNPAPSIPTVSSFILCPSPKICSTSSGDHVPPTALVSESFVTVLHDRYRVFELDEAALRMQQSRLDRDDHARLQRQVRVGRLVGHRTGARQARRLMGDEPHPM